MHEQVLDWIGNMKKVILFATAVLIFALIVFQFFLPGLNQEEMTADHILKQENVPADIQQILENACLDCHSNNTRYLWYHRVNPVAWMINNHVVTGKEELNLSEWGQKDVFDKIDMLDEMCTEIRDGKMPLKSYKAVHHDARLTAEQVNELCAWTEKLSEELLSKAEQE